MEISCKYDVYNAGGSINLNMNAKNTNANLATTRTTAEYMKVRRYVLNLLEKGSDEPEMIPSMNELAKMFGVTRMTVHKALGTLIKSNYLIVQKGIGTFTNPAKSVGFKKDEHSLRIGIIINEGKHCFYDNFYWNYISALGTQITQEGHRVNVMNITSVEPEDVMEEIKNNFINGVIWLDVSGTYAESIRYMCQEKFPVVAVHSQVRDTSSICMNYEKHAREIGLQMLSEGRRNIVFIGEIEKPPVTLHLAGLKAAFEETGISFNEKLFLGNYKTVGKDLGELIDFGINIDAIYICGQQHKIVCEVLKKHHVDIENKCRIICEPMTRKDIKSFNGIFRKYRFNDIAQKALNQLKKMAFKGNYSPSDILVDFDIVKK